MLASTETTSAVFFVRVWLADGKLVRARIIQDLDLIERRDEVVGVVGTADEIEHRVQDWLERLGLGNAAVTGG